jgi:hypothetical protein
LCVCYRSVIEDSVENLNTCKKRISPKSRNRIPSICSSIEQLTLAVEEVCHFQIIFMVLFGSQVSSESMVTNLQAAGVAFLVEIRDFLFCTVLKLTLVLTQPPRYCVLGIITVEAKQPGHEADYLPPSSNKVRNVGGAVILLLQHFYSNVL